jgi:hypothetical protein
MKCTWVDCNAEATHPQVGKDGQQWSDLCDEHHAQLDKASDDFLSGATGPQKMLSAWVKAQGGSKKATERMMRR